MGKLAVVEIDEKKERALATLQIAVDRAAAFFSGANANLFDGFQTAHEVLAQLVFWQCEHVRVTRMLLAGQDPDLLAGTRPALNRAACAERRTMTMIELVDQLIVRQRELDALLRRLPDWNIDFPIKQGGRPCTVEDRVLALAAGIDHHVAQLKRAAAARQIRSTLN